MNQYTAWELWINNNIPVILLVIVLGFGTIGTLFKYVISLHKELREQRLEFQEKIDNETKKDEDSQMASIAKDIKHLVERIEMLFKKHDNHELRIVCLERRCGEQTQVCTEREKSVTDRFKVLHNRVDDVRRDLLAGGHRSYDSPLDRSERLD